MIDKETTITLLITLLKSQNIIFFCMIKGQAKQSRQLHNPKFTLSTANFRTLRVFPLEVLASCVLPQQILNFPSNLVTHFDKPKNLLELPYPTKNIRKCSNKLMTNTSGEINLQSKQDICHIAKVKPATSAHYGADVIPFQRTSYSLRIQRFDKARTMYFTHSKDKII